MTDEVTIANLGAPLSDEDPVPPPPVVPPNVTKVGLARQSESVEATGNLIDYIPLANYCKRTKCKWTVNSIASDVMGVLMPNGKIELPKVVVHGTHGDLLCVYMLKTSSNLASGSVVKRMLAWERITQSWIPANAPHTATQSVTNGISRSQAETLSIAVGAKVGFSAKIVGELSKSLTKSFTKTITLSEETTVTEQFQFPARPALQVAGVYQLVETLTIVPGPNLNNYLEAMRQENEKLCNLPAMPCAELKAELPISYPKASYRQIAATDAPGAGGLSQVMSFEETEEHVKNLVKCENVEG